MKTQHILLFATLSLALYACHNLETEQPDTFRIQARIDGDDNTKTTLGPDRKVLWDEGDAIAVYVDDSTSPVTFTLSEGAGTPVGTFSGPAIGTRYTAVYPGSMAGTRNGSEVGITLPERQNYQAGSFGSGANPMLAINNAPMLSIVALFSEPMRFPVNHEFAHVFLFSIELPNNLRIRDYLLGISPMKLT